ncbi:phosphatidate cytidylyltransferase 4, chloroplastic-like [Impatiens glandulifera]|uniref:phosphatidate cytidylyltransferase 4, chloroplastic-like n=1 Tax=Impatiens glandulifera TaxID=253017 RepID=UPI001FB10C7C|nr:phosphatidate cytidylyltransferase 4, chloroplastic-like [Impatiens glandulifera]
MSSNVLLNNGFCCSPDFLRRVLPLSSCTDVTYHCACHSRALITTRSNISILNSKLLLDASTTGIRRRNLITAVSGAEPEGEMAEEDSASSEQQGKVIELNKRIIFGFLIGLCSGVVVFTGGLVYTMTVSAAVFVGAREYFELIRSRGIAAGGMIPPPRYVSQFCTVICTLMPILTLYLGEIDVWVTSAAFSVAMALLLQKGNPRFAQLSSTMFGLFYCGYLPCFWVKLRCTLAVPALNTSKTPFFHHLMEHYMIKEL